MANPNPPDVVELGKKLFLTVMGQGDYDKATETVMMLGIDKTRAQIIVSAICQALIEGSEQQSRFIPISPN